MILSFSLLSSLFFSPSLHAAGYSPGGNGTVIYTNASTIFIFVRMELWGDGVWNDPTLPSRWKDIIQNAWNNTSGGGVKYKCYDVRVSVDIIVSPTTREAGAEYGTPGYHQIWVPDMATGDMANIYGDYGLYLPEGTGSISYGEYNGETAQQYYEQQTGEVSGQASEGAGGKVSAFVWNPLPIGSDGEKKATFGTIPNIVSDSALVHEFGHLLGVPDDDNSCDDNIMSPVHGQNDGRLQPYPKYFNDILYPLELSCQWNMETKISMDARVVGTYFPPAIEAHNTFVLKESPASFKSYMFALTEGPTDLVYDSIEPQFTCNTFVWEPHTGKVSYRAELRYNLKEDLKNGGRMFLFPMIQQTPYEEIKNVFGCEASGGLRDLSMVNPVNHHNILYSMTGKNMQTTPYDVPVQEPISCPADDETSYREQYYNDGLVINGLIKGSKAEHFPDGDLYGAKFHYDIGITSTSPLGK